jgi:hypothetical protein
MVEHSNEFAQILKNILQQAKYYLEAADEFFPFGAVLDEGSTLHPLGVYSEDEQPDSTMLLNQLESAIVTGIEKEVYKAGGIGIDVYLKVNDFSEKKTAIKIKLFSMQASATHYFYYFKTKDGYSFEETHIS